MADVFDVILYLFEFFIASLKSIPISDNISLFDFSVVILILLIISSAFVSTVSVGSVRVGRSIRNEYERRQEQNVSDNEGE